MLDSTSFCTCAVFDLNADKSFKSIIETFSCGFEMRSPLDEFKIFQQHIEITGVLRTFLCTS